MKQDLPGKLWKSIRIVSDFISKALLIQRWNLSWWGHNSVCCDLCSRILAATCYVIFLMDRHESSLVHWTAWSRFDQGISFLMLKVLASRSIAVFCRLSFLGDGSHGGFLWGEGFSNLNLLLIASWVHRGGSNQCSFQYWLITLAETLYKDKDEKNCIKSITEVLRSSWAS